MRKLTPEEEKARLDELWAEREAADPRYAELRAGRRPTPGQRVVGGPSVPGARTIRANGPDPLIGGGAFRPKGGPGTELNRLLESVNLKPEHGCGCEDMAARMDEWGVAGCKEHRADIIKYLIVQREKTSWLAQGAAFLKSLQTGLLWQLDPLDPLPGLVDEAIRRAEVAAARKVPDGWADRIVLINLDRREDRLERFKRQAARIPELAGWNRLSAVDGATVEVPGYWRGGAGAWGCRLSHLKALDEALEDEIGTLVVFEDDVQFAEWFSTGLASLLASAPDDWEGLLLGCQGQIAAPVVVPGVRRTQSAQRTHAYVVRGREPMQTLRDLWEKCTTHIDHGWFHWQQARKVYQPDPLLCGQAGGRSDIARRIEAERWWEDGR